MKTLKFLFWPCLLVVLVVACQKELSHENGGSVTASDGSLQGAGSNCLGSVVSGTYKKDSTLNSTHFVDVNVNINTAGSYVISTDTINGIYFRATGSFTTTGANTVRLQGAGKPLTPGTNIFTVTYDSTQCSFAVTTIGAGGGGTSVFTLNGSPTNCTGATVQGTYTAGTPTNATNKATINVNVTTVGTYSIVTTAVDGVTFSASGTFSATGAQSVVLAASGIPSTAGSFTVPVTAGASNCNFPLTVVSGSSTAVCTLNGAPNACTGATVQGTYEVGTALTVANTATVQVNVTTIGTYSITTNTLSGVSFSGSGTFSATGVQAVILTASGGPPATAGTYTMTVTVGTSTCTFPLTVVAASDHFPLTANSWWSYDDPEPIFVSSSSDSLKRVNIGSMSFGGNPYRIFQEQDNTTPFDSFYYRKDASNNYFEWNYADFYTAAVAFDADVFGAINFLKEGLTTGQTWTSAEFTGTASGFPLKIQYYDTCTNANATVTISGKTFNNVYIVKWRPKYSLAGAPYQDEFIAFESWFAKGVGLIHFEVIDLSGGSTIAPVTIRNWQVF